MLQKQISLSVILHWWDHVKRHGQTDEKRKSICIMVLWGAGKITVKFTCCQTDKLRKQISLSVILHKITQMLDYICEFWFKMRKVWLILSTILSYFILTAKPAHNSQYYEHWPGDYTRQLWIVDHLNTLGLAVYFKEETYSVYNGL